MQPDTLAQSNAGNYNPLFICSFGAHCIRLRVSINVLWEIIYNRKFIYRCHEYMSMICPVQATVSINSFNIEITYPPSPLRLPSALTAGAGVYSCEFIVSHARPFPFPSADRFQHKPHPARPLRSAAPIEIGATESFACKTTNVLRQLSSIL